ncbi:DNA-binding transcriptional regulator [Maricurvus nonylphenolicus]|uniref:helix-turn-helix domain-containing protein n=1 Tax=Maricurvus nonylphenolicus TaxID=1008307 RepID=UPI0036F32DE6
MSKRDLFAEISEGLEAVVEHNQGKITLKTTELEILPPVTITGAEIVDIRTRLNVSRAVLAAALRIKPRKLEKWEQDISTPSPEAATLIKLMAKHPDMVERIHAL